MRDISNIHPQNEIIFFISKLLQHHPSTWTNDWHNEWWIYPISKWNYFFLFRNYYSIIPVPWPMTDIINDRYIHPQNENIFFYFETFTASFYHLDQWLIWWMIDISILKMIFFLKLLQHHSITLTNDWYNEW